jgi:hypothetical protein
MPSAAELAAALPVTQLAWRPAYRLVSSRFPAADLFARIAAATDWDALNALESLTNARLRDASGERPLVPEAERARGPGASVIMAPFAHLHPEGSRFADGEHGAFYAGESLDTAIAETRHHRELFLRRTQEPPTEIDLRCYLVDIAGGFHDLRGRRSSVGFAEIYDPEHYGASQALARALRARQSHGVCYDSVRRAGGECLGVFRPLLVTNLRQGVHLRYAWNGARIETVYEIRLLVTGPPAGAPNGNPSQKD